MNTHHEDSEDGIYYAPWERPVDRILTPFERFVHRESTSSFFLMAATVLALIIANSALSVLYSDLTHMKVGFSIGSITLEKSLHFWVNDGLMAFFFFIVGLELKREILVGELASLRKAALPIIAAIGGMVMPALFYVGFNPSGHALDGWAIPMATDIAFAIGAMVLLGKRAPHALMAFLVALAIADDLGAVAVIALFYTETIVMPALLAAAGFTLVLMMFNVSGIRWPIPYFCVAVLLWFAMLYSGVHPTMAGIIGAFTVPARPKYDPVYFKKVSNDLLEQFEESYQANRKIITNDEMRSLVQRMESLVHSVMTPLQRLEHIWHIPVAFLVIPVFALFNAGVSLGLADLVTILHHPVLMGVSFGLVLGKFIGITGACWIAVKLGLAQLPDGVRFSHIAGASLLAGIGFTMSIFIAQLAFGVDSELLDIAKTGILLASTIAGVTGFTWLWHVGRDAAAYDALSPEQSLEKEFR